LFLLCFSGEPTPDPAAGHDDKRGGKDSGGNDEGSREECRERREPSFFAVSRHEVDGCIGADDGAKDSRAERYDHADFRGVFCAVESKNERGQTSVEENEPSGRYDETHVAAADDVPTHLPPPSLRSATSVREAGSNLARRRAG